MSIIALQLWSPMRKHRQKRPYSTDRHVLPGSTLAVLAGQQKTAVSVSGPLDRRLHPGVLHHTGLSAAACNYTNDLRPRTTTSTSSLLPVQILLRENRTTAANHLPERPSRTAFGGVV